VAALTAAAPATLAVLPASAQQPVRGEATVTTDGGYGRLQIRFPHEVESQVRLSGGVLVIQFKQPVDVPVDRITAGVTDYIAAARRDPDGKALRFALARKVRLSTTPAAERLYVDLLPDSWTAEPPSLPRSVIEDLARRAQDAERMVRERMEHERQLSAKPIRVRVANQSTFTRYVFELPELIGVASERASDGLTLKFARPLSFDLADAKLTLPETLESIDAKSDRGTATVRFAFQRQVDIRTFREDAHFVVDVSPIEMKASRTAPGGPLAGLEPPQTTPAQPPSAGKTAGPATPPPEPAPQQTAPVPAPAAAERVVEQPAPDTGPADPSRPITVEMRRQGDNLRLLVPFKAPTPAAVFQRADTLWLVFDTETKIDAGVLASDSSRTVRSFNAVQADGAQIVRLKLERPRLVSMEQQGNGWLVSIGESNTGTTAALSISRSIVGPGRTSISIPFDDPRKLHWLGDDDAGDRILVVTALGPARALVKTQDFVDFRALATAHGIAVQPYADDLKAELSSDKILITRPNGLTLSETAQASGPARPVRAMTFDTKAWNVDRDAEFAERQSELIRTAAEAPFTKRSAHRMNLARFYLSRELYPEAKAVLDTALAEESPTADDPSVLVLRAIANIMIGRLDAALKDLSHPTVGNQHDAQLWRAMIHARQGKWADAREGFRTVEGALAALPLELQRRALKDALRASIEVGDYASAVSRLNDFETIGVTADLAPEISVLTGRLALGLGRNEDALAAFRAAGASANRQAAAQGRLREIAMLYAQSKMAKPDAIKELEALTTAWRGDETEVEALQVLARLYTEENRFRDAFHVMRVAIAVHPNSVLTRAIQDEAAKNFDSLFLAGKGDALPAVEALSLFYDYRDLTPIGRRGDEMIRRLADRLVSVDLLDQAAELLQHQVDNRLQGAARAQVATRLAVIYLLNHKPDRAQATLRATRTADLANEIRVPRLLIEARALSDLGRHDFALEVIEGVEGREALRLRSDIHWSARRWQKAAEHIELLYGDRWKGFEPFSDAERSDVLRAAMGYALAEDRLGIARIRDKYAAKMAEGPDRRGFEVMTSGIGVNSAEFRAVARAVAAADTLSGFMRELRARYPEMSTGSPSLPGQPQAGPPPGTRADMSPTGSTARSAMQQAATVLR